MTLAVFWPVLGNQFVDWDDDINFVNNPEFRGLGWANLRFMLTTTMMGHWTPTTWITFGVDYLLWGMNPRGYHLTNLLLHVAAAVAVYLVSLRLLRATMAGGEQALRLGALAAALFFAIHPLRVESVAWVTERRDVLSGLSFVLTVLAYLKAADATGATRRWWLAGSVAAYALAATSKAIVMTLPAVLVLLDVYPLGRLGTRWREWATPTVRPVWLEKIPYVVLAVGIAVMAIHVQRSFAENLVMQPLSFPGRGGTVRARLLRVEDARAVADLAALPDPAPPGPAGPSMLAAAAAVISVSAALLWLRKPALAGRARGVALVRTSARSGERAHPVWPAARGRALQLPPVPRLRAPCGRRGGACSRGGDRRGAARTWARAGGIAAVAGLAALGALSWQQAQIWRDSETLWSYVVAIEPTSAIGHNNLGHSYLKQGRLDEAEREVLTSLRLSPEWDQAHTNLAALLARQVRSRRRPSPGRAGDLRAGQRPRGGRAVPEGGRFAPRRRGRAQQPGGGAAVARRRRARHRRVRARAAHQPGRRAGAAQPRRGPAAPVTRWATMWGAAARMGMLLGHRTELVQDP